MTLLSAFFLALPVLPHACISCYFLCGLLLLLLLLLLPSHGVAAFLRLKGAPLQLFVPRAAREELKALGPDFEGAYKVGGCRYYA